MILGNVINPYFPDNLILFWEHAYTKIKIGSDFAVAVGGEWYPYSGMELLTHFPVAMIAMLIGYILFMPKNGKLPEKATFFLVFVSILLAAQFRSKRFAEYFPPFAILFAAFSLQAFRIPHALQLPEHFKRDIEPYLDAEIRSDQQDRHHSAKLAAVTVLGVLLTLWFVFNIKGFHWLGVDQEGLAETIAANDSDERYRRTMAWATGVDSTGKDNIPAGERIFNCNWDDFPKLFFLDTKHTYVYGLDPNYLFSENPDLYKLLLDITNGKVDDAAPMIREKFGANYVFADAKENEDMFAKLLVSGWVEMVYEDDEARILKIRDVKGEPPKDAAEEQPETEEEKSVLDAEENSVNLNGNVDEEENHN